jgi:hypothetical protein
MGQAWIPAEERRDDPARPRRDDHRSPEAIARRREIRARRGYELDVQPRPAAVAKAPPPQPQSPPDFTIRLPDSCSWGVDGKYARWLLPTHNGRDGLSYREVMEIQLAAKRSTKMNKMPELTETLFEAIRERDELIARVRAFEADLAPMIEQMWAASKRVEALAAQAAE